MEDPRSIFYVPEDRKVIVYMEWEGPAGKHHLEGVWRNPSGKVATMSDFDYEAKETKFGAFWSLALAEVMDTGNWSLEAHVDGESAGMHSFQILMTAKPAGAVPARKMFAPAELYDRALQTSVGVEKFNRNGKKFGEGSGFLLEPGLVVTAFECIDGASKLRITFSDGTKIETDQIIGWNRRQDWAVLPANVSKLPKLRPADANSWNVGDTTSYLDTAGEGNRVISNVSIDGKNTLPSLGMRLNLSAPPADRAVGSALLNEYGEAIGIVAGGLIPGMGAASFIELPVGPANTMPRTKELRGLAVPLDLLPPQIVSNSPTSLSTLDSKGDFLTPVEPPGNISFAQFARTLDARSGLAFPREGGDIFSKKDPKFYAFVMWEGRDKIKGMLTLRLFDLDNRLLNKAALDKPMKFSLSKGEQKSTTWDIGTSSLPVGIYRVDVWLNDTPVWRSFFRLVE
jgi:S1-C subfamily serine protease